MSDRATKIKVAQDWFDTSDSPATEDKQDTIISVLLLILAALTSEVLLENGFALLLETGDSMLLE